MSGDWCQTCETCATRKRALKKNRAPLGTIKTGYPMQVVAVDILGLLLESEAGNLYVLVAGDYFTKWMKIKKTRTSPQCDGLVERFNRSLLDMLAITTKNHPCDWEDQIRKVCMAYQRVW